MEDELELNLDDSQNINKTEQRINSLTSKLGEASRAKEEAERKVQEAEQRAQEAEKKAEFISSFSEVSSKYQGATDFKEQIEEKVAKGYSVEDATVSVLNAEGKLVPQAEEQVIEASQPAAGGSAPTQLPSQGKSADDMTQEERRAELSSPERAAELERILRQGI